MVNVALAPRATKCVLCRRVQAIEDVTLRLFDAEGRRIKAKGARDYLRAIGFDEGDVTIARYIANHRAHVEAWVAKEGPVVPAQVPAVVRIVAIEETEKARWLDVNQSGMDLGMDALRSLRARLDAGELTPREEIALAKLGLSASTTRAAMAARGRESDPFDALMKLAAGVGSGTTD